MKKSLLLLLALCGSMAQMRAQDFAVNSIYYNITVSNTVEVTNNGNYWCYGGRVVVPDSVTYNGTTYAVTSIGTYAFAYSSGMTSLNLPSTLASIGDYAFVSCTGFDSLVVPDGVVSIGSNAFHYCHFTHVSLGHSLQTIGSNAFAYCEFSQVTLPASVTTIGSKAFGWMGHRVDVTCLATVPPATAADAFEDNNYYQPTATVPCGCTAAYQSATGWGSMFTTYEEMCSFTINAQPSDVALGLVAGGGEYALGDTVVLTAVPFAGTLFSGWSDGSVANPLRFVASSNLTLTALFSQPEVDTTHTYGRDTLYLHDTIYLGTSEGIAQEPAAAPQFSLAPNPAVDYVGVYIDEAIEGCIELYDLQGRRLRRQEVAHPTSHYPLSLNGLPSGTYLVKIGPAVRKLIVK